MTLSIFHLCVALQLLALMHETNAKNVYVSSTDGNDFNDGISKPVQTLSKSLHIIRNIREKDRSFEHITVYVESGEYYPIQLEPKDSNITFIGTSNETTISGGYVINTQWTKRNNNNNIWTTSISLPSNYSKIYKNNTMNFPKQFWYNESRRSKINTDILYWESTLDPTNPSNNINKYGLIYKKGDIQESWNLYAPGVVIFVYHQWTVSLHQVKYHDFDNQTILFEQPSDFVLGQFLTASQKRWYIEGIAEMEISENCGEWNAMLDDINNPKEMIINYSPFKNEPFPPINDNMIYIEHPFEYKPLVSMVGTWSQKVENVVFDTFNFKYSSYLCPPIPQKCDGDGASFLGNSIVPGAIHMELTQNITIKNSVFNHIGSWGIFMNSNSIQTNILYNNVSDIGAGAVQIGWSSNDTLISDNYIVNGGFIFRHGSGIVGGGSSNITIQHNEFTKLISNGIDVDGGPKTPYLVINKNHIHHNGRNDKWGISDYGAFHLGLMNQSCCTTQVTNNKLHDIISVIYGGEGLYLDWGSSDVFVYGNLVYNIAGYTLNWNYQNSVPAPPHKYPVPPVIVRNNILITSGSGQSTCVGNTYLPNTTFERGIHWGSGPPPYIGNGVFTNNINYIFKPNGTVLFSNNEQYSWFTNSSFDYNVYYTPKGNNIYFPAEKVGDEQITLEQWQNNTKQDLHSLITDPKFVDIDDCNFQLQSDSPVFKHIDFQPLNLSDVGPRY